MGVIELSSSMPFPGVDILLVMDKSSVKEAQYLGL
jgi:hypothetical protein